MRWVRLLTKVQVCLPNDAKELFEYYCKQKEIEVSKVRWMCYCCHKKTSNIVAALVVDAYGEHRNLYLTFISLDCLKEYIKNPENPITFQILEEDLLFISKYDPSSDFVNICIKES